MASQDSQDNLENLETFGESYGSIGYDASDPLGLLKRKLSERTLSSLDIKATSQQELIELMSQPEKIVSAVFHHAGDEKLLDQMTKKVFTMFNQNQKKETEVEKKIQQDTLAIVVIDVDYWSYFPSLSSQLNNLTNIPPHGLLAVGVKVRLHL